MSEIDPHSTALMVMDVQRGIVRRISSPTLLERIAAATRAARAAGVRVIYVRVAFRPGFPEVSPRNRSFSTLRDRGGDFAETDEATQIEPSVEPQAGDLVVVKRRVSAFSGSDLDVLLRAHGIAHLVLTGIATSGVVLSTLRQAADQDFQITVLSDGCTDSDPEVHRVLMEKVFPRQAEVLTTEEWVKRLHPGAQQNPTP